MEEFKRRGDWQGAARPMSAAELSSLGAPPVPQSRQGPGSPEAGRTAGSGHEPSARLLRAVNSADPATRNADGTSDQPDPRQALRLTKSTEGVFEPLWSSEGSFHGDAEAIAPSEERDVLHSNVTHRPHESYSTKGGTKGRAAAGGGGNSPRGLPLKPAEGPGTWPPRLYELAWVLIVIAGSGFLYLLGASVHAPSISLPLPSLNPSQFPGAASHPGSRPGALASLLTPIDSLGAPSASGGLGTGAAEQGQEQGFREGVIGSGGLGADAGAGVQTPNGEGPELAAGSDQEMGPKLFHDDYVLARRRQPLSATCDLWTGRWVYDASYPLWAVGSCQVGLNGSGCTELGRKDSDFMRFRWQPDACTLPRFSAARMRRKLRGKRVVFLGDSLARNQLQSLLCMLASDLPRPQSTVEEISGASQRPRLDWRVFAFRGFNFTLEYYLSRFLVLQRSVPRHITDAPKKVSSVVDTESMDWGVGALLKDSLRLGLTNDHNMILVVNAGHWFNRGKLFDKGVYFLAPGGQEVNTSMSIPEGFEAGMRTVATWLQTLKREHGVIPFWRGYSPIHFVGGSWNSGGHCKVRWPLRGLASPSLLRLHRRQTNANTSGPAAVGGVSPHYKGGGDGAPGETGFVDDTGAMAETAAQVMQDSGVPVLDVWPLSHMRPDGHPATYYKWGNPAIQDCSHWCLPGVPDTWNELLLAHLTAHKLL